ncbi:flippase [Haloarchaeobius amylolyticus]|uniref:Flippase n=1 Tax=Haloarchaeobius amylolyticus TaxID=1198296 RepID=A0ABD6BCJ7_9EURY
MNLSRSSAKLFLSQILSKFLGFVGLIFFARELGANQLGIFFLYQALLGILAIPTDFGIRFSLVKRLSESGTSYEFISSAIILKSILLFPICAAILIFRQVINQYLGAELALLLVVGLILQEFANLSISILKGELRVGLTALPTLSQHFIYVIVGAILIFIFQFGVYSLVYAQLLGLFIMMVLALHRSSVELKPPSYVHSKSLINYSKYAFISSIGGLLFNWFDVIAIGYFLTQTDVGAYETAWRVSGIVMLLSTAIATSIFPQISKWNEEGETARIEAVFTKSIIPSLMLIIPSFFGVLLLSNDILTFVFGQEYNIASKVLIILMVSKIFQGVHKIAGQSLLGINQPNLAARSSAISLVLNLVLNILLVWKIGIVGAAIGTVAATLVNNILHVYYLSKFIAIEMPWKNIRWCILSSVIMSVVVYVYKISIGVESLISVFSVVIVGAVVYGLMLLSSKDLREKSFSVLRGSIY